MQGVAGDVFEEGGDEPVEAGGDVAGEGDGVALDVDAVVGFDEMPVGVEAPEEAVIVVGGEDFFACGAGVFYFCDSRAARLRGGVGGVDWVVENVVFGIEDYGEGVVLFEAEGDLEVVAGFGEEFGAGDLRCVVVGVVVVVWSALRV